MMNGDDNFNWGDTSEDTNTDPFADDDFFSTPEEKNTWQDEQLPDEDAMQQQGINEQEVFTKPHQKSPLGYKAVAGIIVVFLIILALTLSFIDRLSFTKKPQPQQTEAQQQMQQGVNENTQTQGSTEQQTTDNSDFSDKGGKYQDSETTSQSNNDKINTQDSQKVTEPVQQGGMQELPSDVTADYSGDVFESTGTIHDKIKYLENSQVVYCLEIEANIGDKSKLIKYYCGYNTYNSVDTGDTVNVTYQVVSDTCYSVNTISK